MPLTAYYFMGQDLCVVRRHVREDMQWLADAGTDNVAVGVHEFQLQRLGDAGLDIICAEASRAGLGVHAIASRWGGLVAGWPTAAGMFAATHPEAWIRNADGTPLIRSFAGGGICSIYHPATAAFFQASLDRMLDQWPFAGLIWDEPKTLEDEDHSEAAVLALGGPSTGETHVRNMAEFFSKANRHALEKKPDLVTSCFVYAHFSDLIMQAFAAIDGLDYFGIDGLCRPNPGTYPRFKTVFGNMDRANAACRAAGVKSFCLVETGPGGIPLEQTIAHVREFLKTPIDHLLYYYHGSCTSPMDRYMSEMKTVVQAWRRRQE